MDLDQPLPRLWLMTDERLGNRLFDAVARLPEGAGIVLRHYGLAGNERRALLDRVRAAHPGLLLLAGPPDLAASWGADGSHGRHPGALTASAHNLAELRLAEAAGVRLVFLSPVYATRSHPGAGLLGPDGFAALAAATALPAVALGGMNAQRAKGLAGALWLGGNRRLAPLKPESGAHIKGLGCSRRVFPPNFGILPRFRGKIPVSRGPRRVPSPIVSAPQSREGAPPHNSKKK